MSPGRGLACIGMLENSQYFAINENILFVEVPFPVPILYGQ